MSHRMQISKEDAENAKKLIFSCIEAEGDYKLLAGSLGIKKSTLSRWIAQGYKKDMRGGHRNNKIGEEHRSFICNQIEINPRLTLQELADLLFQRFNLSVSKECIRQHLDGMVYTLKSVRFEPETANSEINRQKRQAYVRTLLQYQSRCIPILYIDEANFNVHITRTSGRSVKGTRCNVVASASKGANLHLIGCISNAGPVNFSIKRGSFNKESAMSWIKETLRLGNEMFGRKVVLVLDNAPAHSGAEELLNDPEISEILF